MKTIRVINKIVVIVPIALLGLGLLNFSFIFLAVLFTACTGATQLFLAIMLLNREAYREKVLLYLGGVVLYFVVCMLFFQSIPEPINYLFAAGIPFLLAAYISNIIHKKIES